MRPEEFMAILASSNEQPSPFRLGKIPATYTSGRPQVLFDGETTASARTYQCLNGYTPAANDRVLLARVGSGWVILDKLKYVT